MMQASGYYYICFNTDTDCSEYTDKSIMTLTMEEYRNGLSDENMAIFENLGEDGYSLDFYVDIPECMEDASDSTEIHIISSNFSRNHPHTDIIFTNGDEKLVYFTSIG